MGTAVLSTVTILDLVREVITLDQGLDRWRG